MFRFATLRDTHLIDIMQTHLFLEFQNNGQVSILIRFRLLLLRLLLERGVGRKERERHMDTHLPEMRERGE